MAKSPNAKKNPLELGDSGVQIFNGIITGEEYQPALHGRQLMRTVEEMRRGRSPKDAGMEALKRIQSNTVEKRLLNARGLPTTFLALAVPMIMIGLVALRLQSLHELDASPTSDSGLASSPSQPQT